MENLVYSLHYDWNGREKEVNFISPALTDESFTLDEVSKHIRAEFELSREAIRIARKYHCELDISSARGLLKISLFT